MLRAAGSGCVSTDLHRRHGCSPEQGRDRALLGLTPQARANTGTCKTISRNNFKDGIKKHNFNLKAQTT